MHSEPDDRQHYLRDKIIGLGERSIRKSYYPQLRQQLEAVKKNRTDLQEKSASLLQMVEKLNAVRAKLSASEAQLRTILETSPDGIILITTDGTLLEANRAGLDMLETSSAKGAKPNIFTMIAEEFQDTFRSFHECVIGGKQGTLEFEIVGAKGTRRWIEARGAPLCHSTSDTLLHLDVMRDISERKKIEAEQRAFQTRLHQAQRLESLGVLAGGIAHDFNNILMVIMGQAEIVLDELSPSLPCRDNVFEIMTAAKRAADLCGQMLAYSGKTQFQPRYMSVDKLVEETLQMLKTSISKKAILHLNLAQSLPGTLGDPTQIRQVLMNMVINASDAIGEQDGNITITTGTVDCEEPFLADSYLLPVEKPGTYVYFDVSDTGCGMDQNTMEHLFEPFFTTKFLGRGLGMAAVMGIIKAHKGALSVHSEIGKGTTFKVLLPAGGLPEDHGTEHDVNESWHGSGTVLLVDDEQAIRQVTTKQLKKLGMKVLTAEDGQQAVDTYREHASEIDLVLLDVTMPHMSGGEACQALRKISPDVCIVIASGYAEEDVASQFKGEDIAGFLQKPYTLTKLRSLLSTLLPEAGKVRKSVGPPSD